MSRLPWVCGPNVLAGQELKPDPISSTVVMAFEKTRTVIEWFVYYFSEFGAIAPVLDRETEYC